MKRNLIRWVARSKKQIVKIIQNEKFKQLLNFNSTRKLIATGILPIALVGQIRVLPTAIVPASPVVTSINMKLADGYFNEQDKNVKIVVGESETDKQARIAREQAAAQASQRTSSRMVVARDSSTSRNDSVGSNEKHQLAQPFAAQYGIDWKLLVAVWQIESGKAMGATRSSSAGAMGPMQFMPGTWRSMGVDANGDGVADINNVYDALASGARYLASNGAAQGDIDNALFHYNHSQAYVNQVKSIMNSI